MSDPDYDQAAKPDTTHSDAPPPADLGRIEQDLADVEVALARLADGTYFVDEVSGTTIPDDVLDRNPLARRAG
ncbi:MAG TPA: hypothetical protein VMM60_00785 [Ilumatobacter sp.]|nr:hypothetical protein [Ilumatobacter sp.]